jgi:multidrug resistance efflux pump
MNTCIKFMAVAVPLALSGCGEHNSSAREIVPKIESYKAALGTMVGCGRQIEGAKALIEETEDIYKSRAFKKYVESATREINRAEKNCDRYERYKGEAAMPAEKLEKAKDTVVEAIKSALTVIENGINQQEAYKAMEH